MFNHPNEGDPASFFTTLMMVLLCIFPEDSTSIIIHVC